MHHQWHRVRVELLHRVIDAPAVGGVEHAPGAVAVDQQVRHHLARLQRCKRRPLLLGQAVGLYYTIGPMYFRAQASAARSTVMSMLIVVVPP